MDIKKKRIELNLTMKEVAEYVGVSEATVSRWESGNIANMKRSRIKLLSEILHVSPLDIIGEYSAEKEHVENPIHQSEHEQLLLANFRELSEKEQTLALHFVQGLLEIHNTKEG